MAAHSFLELAERLVTEPLEKAELRDAMNRDDVGGWLDDRGFGDLDPEDVATAMAHVGDAMPPRVAAELGDEASLADLAEVDLASLGLDDLDDYRPLDEHDDADGDTTDDLDDLVEDLAGPEPTDGIDDEGLDGDGIDAGLTDVGDEAGDAGDAPGGTRALDDEHTDEIDAGLEDLSDTDPIDLDAGGAPALPDVPTLVEESLDESGLGELPDLSDTTGDDHASGVDDIDSDLVDLDESGDLWQDDDF
ncbi:MAG: hypothetical protein S0880_03400 [Actinomycetota bacterium]|nr:hypothetical protein [Actinomycetota bacterium]